METTQQAFGSDQAQRRSSRGCLWLIVAIPVILILVCGGIFGGIFVLVVGTIRSSEPYQMALEQVQRDPQVIERLGEPIEDATVFPTGNVNVANDRGTANLQFAVKGPKGRADVSTQARRAGGKWGLTKLDVTFGDGQRASLDTEPEGGPGDAPTWPPAAKRP